MVETLYWWLVNRLARTPYKKRPVTLWVWRRTVMLREINKHARRGNWGQARNYVRMLF